MFLVSAKYPTTTGNVEHYLEYLFVTVKQHFLEEKDTNLKVYKFKRFVKKNLNTIGKS